MANVLKTLEEITNEVLNFGFNDGPQVNKGRIEKWVNEGEFQIARQVNAPEFIETESLTLSQGKYKYTLPSEFLRMLDIYYPEIVTRLRPMDLQQFDVVGQGKFEGPPEMYTIYKEELWLFPTPNNNTDKLELRYVKQPPEMSAGANEPILNSRYRFLLVDYAVSRAFEAEDDAEQAQVHWNKYKEDLAHYATDVQKRWEDRPRQVDGTWQGTSYGSRGVI